MKGKRSADEEKEKAFFDGKKCQNFSFLIHLVCQSGGGGGAHRLLRLLHIKLYYAVVNALVETKEEKYNRPPVRPFESKLFVSFINFVFHMDN